ncbi:Wzz/FepE/Etk N-terminal domain-containing protein [Echinimonas agarilytica]|uniref:Wzz/FepE/Etk N-terminal domain-containing protein n=1 Tax=Echinimonas agarilytica TaxID=1215918 RepID=A0AA41W6C2_9GAMM|nr:Wzz/FepE/Etk N-terminal domain-containing protein [Echinimonas agarilytica]MCM2679502.1 Wzz/FepE/Etk N-terminal domain-containing protein [Echinimonas agarilytica]
MTENQNMQSQQPLPQQTLQGQYAWQDSRAEDEIDLRELWSAIWQGKWLIIAVTFVFAAAGVLYALAQPNEYKAEALLAPVSESGGGMGGMGQLGGLASLAGISLGGGGGDNKALLAQQVLKSRKFVASFIERRNILVPLMAAKGWNLETDSLVLDPSVYDEQSKVWLREVQLPKTPEPSAWQAHKAFTSRLQISEDKASGYVTLGFEFYSPTLAKQWVDWLVVDINNHIRALDTEEAKRSIDFLAEKLKETSYAEMQKIFFQLVEEQTKTIMLAEVRDEYVFKTVDPAVIAEEKSKPKRALICILATLLGGMLAVGIVLIRYAFSDKK